MTIPILVLMLSTVLNQEKSDTVQENNLFVKNNHFNGVYDMSRVNHIKVVFLAIILSVHVS